MAALIVDILSWALIVGGGAFCVIGAVGMLRMPDVFTRMHAAGIIDTAGLGLILIGLMLQAGFTLVMVKLALILVFVLYTSPMSTHALAQSAVSTGVKPLLADGANNQKAKEDEPSKT
ncbi:monovalent cation/H(+) antiporter subunit G [Shumkonia mesophila]|uniref:monovalent cation/H(+) antiporter subunit G n=1 Tax=Shumkonia mesophila TaxID=2838854 RepID=UPI00293531D3|nr:monovalent cation/H(+) antiporter subunit G [Shumkonia mesophila]